MIDGPRLPPSSGRADALVVLLHGYGSNGDDLISLAPYWTKALPGAAFLSPHAPQGVPGYPGGRQWFPITRLDPAAMAQGVASAAAGLDRFLDRELERLGLGPDRLAIVGFSQGCMLALHVGLRRAQPPAAIVGYSGLLAGPERLEREARGRPPILLVHGAEDDVIPVGAMFEAAAALAAAGLSAQWRVCYGLGHSIAPEGLDLGGAFLQAALGGKLR